MPIVVSHNVDPVLTGGLAFLAGQNQYAEDQRRQAVEEELRRAAMAEQARQFNERQALADVELQMRQRAAEQQNALALRQIGQRDRSLQAQLLADQYRSADRFNAIALQGEQQRAMYGDQIAARLAAEQMQQAGIAGRQENALRGQVYMQRLAQRFREMDRDRESIRRANLSQDQLDEAASQFEMKWGESLDQVVPPLGEQYPVDDMDPVSVKAKLQSQYPDTPFVINPDGRVTVPGGWRPELDPKYREEEYQQKLDLHAMQQQQREEQAAAQANQREQQRQDRIRDARFKAAQARHDARMPKESRYKSKTLEGVDQFDEAGYNAAMQQWEQEAAAIAERYYGAESQQGEGDQVIDVSSAEEIQSKVKMGGRYRVNGVVFTRTR